MAKPDVFMPIFIGDYFKDTMHLMDAEHGSYMLLLFHYWVTGTALPDDDKKLAAIARCERADWPDRRRTLEPFFEVRDGRWHHKRVESELQKARERSNIARNKANLRWDKPGNGMPQHSHSNAAAMPQHSSSNAGGDAGEHAESMLGRCSSHSQSYKKDSPPTPPHPGSAVALEGVKKSGGKKAQARPYDQHPDFERFYQTYPRPTDKGAAFDSWIGALKRGQATAEQIITAAERYAVEMKRENRPPDKIKHPATWLNADAFLDGPAQRTDLRLGFDVPFSKSQLAG